MMRLFIAINFSQEFKQSLINIINQIKPQVKKAKYTLYENLHLTLVFIGETDDVATITNILNSIDAEKFTITLSKSGSFKRDDSEIFWVGLNDNPVLTNVANMFVNSLCNKGFNIKKEKFIPHITLARELIPNSTVEVNFEKISMTVEQISLMKSERINKKLTYTEILAKKLK